MILRWHRWPLRRLLTAAPGPVRTLCLLAAHRPSAASARPCPRSAALPPRRARPARPRPGNSVGFANSERLEEHYQKHGAEFGNITQQDYLHQAQLLRDVAVGGPVIEAVRRDGVFTRFDRQTGAFIAVNPNGVIRTFFKPNDGERYFRRQSERD